MNQPNLAELRQRMVEEQLIARGIRDQRVLAAMGKVPREAFVPDEMREFAYEDRALPIDMSQTISQPYIVALMTEALQLEGSEKVLEIGTGSGYQAAILCELAHFVVSIERHEALTKRTAGILQALGYDNLRLQVGDGTLGSPADAPFDRIIVTAAAPHPPKSLWKQLSEGGLLVLPLGDAESQVLKAVRKENGQAKATDLSGCRFVKLIGEEGW